MFWISPVDPKGALPGSGFLVYKGGAQKSYNQKLPKLLSIPICMRFHNEGSVLKKTAFFTPESWEAPGRVDTRMASPQWASFISLSTFSHRIRHYLEHFLGSARLS